MPRGRAAPASKPAASSSHAPAKTQQPAQQQHQQAPQQPQQPQVHHVVHHHTGGGMAPASRGPGLMGMMAASAAGSIAGNYISNQFFSNSNGQPLQHPPQELQNYQSAQQAAQQAQASQDPCKAYFDTYAKCLEMAQSSNQTAGNASAVTNCQWSWDLLSKCKSGSPM